MNIAVFGLGKLGSPMAAVFTLAGHTVVGVDVNQRFVDAINKGKAPVQEPQLDEVLATGSHLISATTDGYEAAKQAEAIFIIVPTPSRDDGLFDNRYILECLKPIGKAIGDTGEHKKVVVVSTVVPRGNMSSMAAEILPALVSAGAPRGHFDLLYNPEFIALGSVIHDMLFPDYILIGGGPTECKWLASFWGSITNTGTPARCMNWINAELTKILQNVIVTQKISAANMVGNICERFHGADADTVLAAIGTDTRVGDKYLKAATAYGGPCFPRDSRALSRVAQAVGVPDFLPGATRMTNVFQTVNLVDRVVKLLDDLPERTVGVLGLTYKPNTPVCEESAAIKLVNGLDKEGLDVLVWDPSGHEEASHCVSSAVRLADSFKQCVSSAAVLVIAVPWAEFRRLDPAWLERGGYHPAILDCWQMYEARQFEGVATYHAVGKSD